MNESKRNEMRTWLDERIAFCTTQVKTLELDDRRDEAVFLKIRMNVYDIFRTVFKASAGQADPDTFFLEKLDQIPGSWRTSLSQARQHGNDDKAHIEQIKLDAANEIRDRFLKLQEVQA